MRGILIFVQMEAHSPIVKQSLRSNTHSVVLHLLGHVWRLPELTLDGPEYLPGERMHNA
jgi:hypothetical protein